MFLIAALLCAGAHAAPSFKWSLGHYQHTAFTKKDGAPQATFMVETSDGYLWLNDSKGLVRFDGHRFEAFVPPRGEALAGKQVAALFAPRRGGLWVSFDQEGVSHLQDGHVTNYGKKEGFEDKAANFYEDRQGNLIAYAFPHLLKFSNGRWTTLLKESPPLGIRRTGQDEDFNLWATTSQGALLVLREGAERFVDTGIQAQGAIGISAGPDHTIFVSLRSGVIKRYADRDGVLTELGTPLPYYGRKVLVDRRGLVWISTANDGVHFLGDLRDLPLGNAPLATDEGMNRAAGLTGNFANPFQDRHGTIWVATGDGVDRFTPSVFSQVPLPNGMTMVSVAPGADGDAWIGSENFPMRHLVRDAMLETTVPRSAMTLHTAGDRTVYAATADVLWQLAPGTPRVVAELPFSSIGGVKAIELGPDGAPWLSFRNKKMPFARLERGAWERLDGWTAPSALFKDPSGTLWAGLEKDQLARLRDGKLQRYGAREGLATGIIKAITARDGLLWLGGDQQVQSFDGKVFRTLKLAGAEELSDIGGLVFDDAGNLWLHMLAGLVRIDHADVQRAAAGHLDLVPYRLFDALDGMPGTPAQTYTLPTLRRGADGRLWVTGQTAAAWLDPGALDAVRPLNPAVVERLASGEEEFDTGIRDQLLPDSARDLRISYAAPELQFPERVRYQYRLRGFDDKWIEAGKDTRASFSHLAGGAYVFEVRAAWQGTPWTGAPTSLAFAIAPRYHETLWFRALLVMLALIAIWLLIRFQMRAATRRERARMQIRLDERTAVARDLHDTLLQSNQAVVLQLHALATAVADPAVKTKLDYLMRLSQDAAIEGRDKVDTLRAAEGADNDSVDRFLALGRGLSAQHGIAFSAQVKGKPRPLQAGACLELLPMVSELLVNAFRHAGAGMICVTVSYGYWRFTVEVRDDGSGIADEVLRNGAAPGHWGLQGVKERAARMGARATFGRNQPTGSRITIAIAAGLLYAPP